MISEVLWWLKYFDNNKNLVYCWFRRSHILEFRTALSTFKIVTLKRSASSKPCTFCDQCGSQNVIVRYLLRLFCNKSNDQGICFLFCLIVSFSVVIFNLRYIYFWRERNFIFHMHTPLKWRTFKWNRRSCDLDFDRNADSEIALLQPRV